MILKGVDPIWNKADNSIAFLNSYKMKLAVIIGVIHMVCGIILKGVNNLHFK
jgi:V-type H+-transporting ATPase subunit a